MLGKSLHICFSRLKRPSPTTPPQIQIPLHVPSSSSSSSVVYKNFNSLYDPISDSETLTLSSSSATTSSSSSSDSAIASDPDLSSAIASRRLFPSSPGPSNSILDSAAVSVGTGSGVAVPTYSPDPYSDFRRSMEEMVVALGLDPWAHRAHLHELLLCYLALNRKHAHKYIVGAFADLLVGLSAIKPPEI